MLIRLPHLMPCLCIVVAAAAATSRPTAAAINNWHTGRPIPGLESYTVGPNVNLDGLNLSEADFRNNNLPQTTFRGSNLSGASFDGANATRADFTNSDLTRTLLLGTNVTSAAFDGAIIHAAQFNNVVGFTELQLRSTASFQAHDLQLVSFPAVSNWDLSSQNLTGAYFFFDVSGANFDGASIAGAFFYFGSNLTLSQLQSTRSYRERDLQRLVLDHSPGWDFSHQNLTGARLNGSLASATFSGALIEQASFQSGLSLEQLVSTESYHQRNLRDIDFGQTDVSGYNFEGQNLQGSQFSLGSVAANFDDANVLGASFRRSDEFSPEALSYSQLVRTASYRNHDLRGIQLPYAQLAAADFHSQNLTNAVFRDADLTSADFTNADLTGATFLNLDLEDVSNTLDQARFDGAIIEHVQFGYRNLTEAQLRSTASFQNKTLSGVYLGGLDITNWDLHDQRLNGAVFGSSLEQVDLRGANLSNATLRSVSNISLALFGANTIYNQWTTFPTGFDPVAAGLTLRETPRGDFTGDGLVDAVDFSVLEAYAKNDLCCQFKYPDKALDLNGDGKLVGRADADLWIREIRHTWYGDANLDGEFNSDDLIRVFQTGEYEDALFDNSTWATGDWNFDSEFNSEDLILAFQDGGYEVGPRPAVAAVPEPHAWTSVPIALLLHTVRRRQR